MFVDFLHCYKIYQMKHSLKIKLQILTAFASLFILSCKSKAQKESIQNTDRYDFAQPKIINLPQSLDEISGIAYYAKDTSVFAIIDEDGLLFRIPLNRPDIVKEWRFDKQRDYEDIIYKDSIFYVMVSNGDLDKIPFTGDKIAVDKIDFPNASKKVNEFETLYLTGDGNRIVMLCKQCQDDKKASISSYYFNDSAKQFLNFEKIESARLFEKLASKNEKIKPSAAAVNPITKELYVLCSGNKIIFIKDSQGKIKDVAKLKPIIYKQPKGKSFTPDAELIISNEVNSEGYATLAPLKNKKNK